MILVCFTPLTVQCQELPCQPPLRHNYWDTWDFFLCREIHVWTNIVFHTIPVQNDTVGKLSMFCQGLCRQTSDRYSSSASHAWNHAPTCKFSHFSCYNSQKWIPTNDCKNPITRQWTIHIWCQYKRNSQLSTAALYCRVHPPQPYCLLLASATQHHWDSTLQCKFEQW